MTSENDTQNDKQTTGKIRAKSQELKARAQEPVTVHGHGMRAADVLKFGGLLAFFALMGVACWLAWPYIHAMFEPGGAQRVMNHVHAAGPSGVFILLGIQLLQVIVAFIPGEVVQIAAGMIYGPWGGAAIILAGCLASSALIFQLVHRLGAPFVQQMVSGKFLGWFQRLESSGKLNAIVFILFLIPGLPKDVFTYFVPLTNMRMRTFLTLTTIARIPGVVVSTYAANGIVEGRVLQSVAIFAVAAVIAVVGLALQKPLMNWIDKHTHRNK